MTLLPRGPGRRAGWLAVALWALLVTPQHYRRDVHTANESIRVYAALGLAVHGTASLDPVFDRYAPGWRGRGGPPTLDAARVHGHYTLDKAPGVTLAATPVVAAAQAAGLDPGAPEHYPALTWLLALLLAAAPTAWFAFVLTRRLQRGTPLSEPGPPERAPSARVDAPSPPRSPASPPTWVVAPLVLSTPWLAYGGLLFGHALAAALVGLGTLAALGPWAADEDLSRGPRARTGPLLGGLALGWAVVTEYPAALTVLAVALGLAADRARRARLGWLALGGAVPLAALLTWNTLVFGAPTAISYHFKAFGLHAAIHGEGLYGVTWPDMARLWELALGSRRGLFFQAPWLLVGLVGALAVARDRRLAPAWRVTLPLAAVGVPVALSGFVDWRAGDAMGPRHWLPALPFLGMAAGLWAPRWQAPPPPGAARPWQPLVVGALLGLVVSATALAVVGAWVNPYFAQDVVNPLFEVNLPVLLGGGAAPTVWRTASPSGLSGAAAGTPSWPWLAAALAALALAAAGGLRVLWAAAAGRRWLGLTAAGAAAILHVALAAGPSTPPAPRAAGPAPPGLSLAVERARATTWELLGHRDAADRIRRALRRLRSRPRPGAEGGDRWRRTGAEHPKRRAPPAPSLDGAGGRR